MRGVAFLVVLWLACVLDLLFGDPRRLPHPVRLIGRLATLLESFTRKLPVSAVNSGRLTVVAVLLITGCISAAMLLMLARLPEPLFLTGAASLLYTTVAARDLIRHAQQVYAAFDQGLAAARSRLAMIVGRDTEQLDEAGVIRACVESVAENMSDGITAPLFWAVAGAAAALPAGGRWPVVCGVTAAMLYKAVNTMDSMFGYTSSRYLEFGSFPARLDDGVNFLPARISGLALVAASLVCGFDTENSWKILCRDHSRHASPNAGWPESAVAGALGLQLGGDSRYFGKLCRKPVLGDSLVSPLPKHIHQVNRLVLCGSFFCLLLYTASFWLWSWSIVPV